MIKALTMESYDGKSSERDQQKEKLHLRSLQNALKMGSDLPPLSSRLRWLGLVADDPASLGLDSLLGSLGMMYISLRNERRHLSRHLRRLWTDAQHGIIYYSIK